MRHHLRRSAAAPVLVQQPVRRLSDVPRLRQHHRARHGSGRAGSVEVDSAERHRALEQAALPRAARRAEAGRAQEQDPARRAVGGADRRGEALRHRGRRRLRRHPRLLPLARAEEIQGPRPRVSQPLPRLPDLSRLRRRAPAPRGARRARRRPHDRSGVVADRPRGAAVLCDPRRSPRRKRRSPRRS